MGDVRQSSKSEILEEFKKLAKGLVVVGYGSVTCYYECFSENAIERLDDDFLGRFLIGHQYNIFTALKAVRNFESFVNRRRERWLKLEKSHLEQIFGAHIVDVLEENGIQDQKVVWIRLEKWNPQTFTADEILEVSGLLCELVYAKTKVIKHIDVIIDLHKFSLKHLYGLSPKFAKRMVFFMSECLPMTMLHVYIVRQPKIFYLVYSLFKPFIEERMRKLINVCGYNYEFLLANVGSEVLPRELGGKCDTLKPSRWMNILNNKKTEKDLQNSGYRFF